MRESGSLHRRRIAKERSDLVRRAYQEGHAIGTHSQTHADLSRLTLAAAARRSGTASSPFKPRLVRNEGSTVLPRAGPQTTADLRQFLFKRDLMLWSVDVDPEDWRPQSAEAVVEHILFFSKRSTRASYCFTMCSRIRRRQFQDCFGN